MPSPRAADLLDAWDAGARASRAERALLLVQTMRSEGIEELAAKPLGWIAAELLRLRAALVGPTLVCLVNCRDCETMVESHVEIAQLAERSSSVTSQMAVHRLQAADFTIEFRLPTYGDLIALGGDRSNAATALARTIVTRAMEGERAVPADAIPLHLHAAIGEAVLEQDPLARIELAITCPACGSSWMESLDVGDFVWSEVSSTAEQLLVDVARLAAGYGWSEADILAMSDRRRRHYLELLPS